MAKFETEDLRRLAAKGGPEARKIAREALGVYGKDEVDRLAMKVLGVLAEASTQELRRRALEKARRMLATR